jgi:hypothetical protein
MIVSPHFVPPDSCLLSNHPSEERLYLYCVDWFGLALIRLIVCRRRTPALPASAGEVRLASETDQVADIAEGRVVPRTTIFETILEAAIGVVVSMLMDLFGS